MRRTGRQQGFILQRFLISMAIFGIAVSIALSAFGPGVKYHRTLMARSALFEQSSPLVKFLQHDIANAGVGLFYGTTRGPRLMVKESTGKTPQPVAWIGNAGKELFVLAMSAEPPGVVRVVNGNRLVISGVHLTAWQNLPGGTPLLTVGPTGDPALVKTSAKKPPQPTVEADFPTAAQAQAYDLTTCVTVEYVDADACNYVTPLAKTPVPQGFVAPVTGIVRYFTEAQTGYLYREELVNCEQEVQVPNRTLLALTDRQNLSFAYVTTAGTTTTTLPADLTTLKGIAVSALVTDDQTKQAVTLNWQTDVKEWVR